MGVAHFALDLGLGNQGGDRVDDQNVDGAAAHQRFGNLEGLLAGIGLGHEQVVGLDAELAGVLDVQGVLGVDECGDASFFLGFGDDVQGQGRFARGLRTVDLDDAASGYAADAEGQVEAEGAGGDRRDSGQGDVFTQAHDAALAELLFYLAHGQLDRLIAVFIRHELNLPGNCWN